MSDLPKILLVDDEPEIVEYLKIVLEGHGFECVGVNSPADGIVEANKQSFSAIVSDMKMPKMTGIEMIAHIRTSTYNSNTPVIVLSGALTDDMLMKLEKLGIIDVMSKPPDIDVLVRVIQKAAKNRTKKTGKSYNPQITGIVHSSFAATVKSHLGDKISVGPAAINETPMSNIEYCGMVNLIGRRLCGVVTISYQVGFTAEFAKVMMGREIVGKELEIFETSAGEFAEQVVQAVAPALKDALGQHIEPMAPLVVHGRHAAIPLPGTQPRVLSTATLNGKNCYLEFAFMDLAETFAGRVDALDTKIIQDA